ncbi:hypothetical protein QQP08_010934 [Theobroma cacao]|nr:hypothetical protein QQP08_010934 [Theobroma cacao]
MFCFWVVFGEESGYAQRVTIVRSQKVKMRLYWMEMTLSPFYDLLPSLTRNAVSRTKILGSSLIGQREAASVVLFQTGTGGDGVATFGYVTTASFLEHIFSPPHPQKAKITRWAGTFP